MRERRQIVELWRRGEASVLITVVAVKGSSYRQPGARLLVDASGSYAGSISGGCLEADILRKAAWRVRDGAAIEHYSTTFDDSAEAPFGLGCGGLIDLLLEPANTPESNALMTALAASLLGDASAILTWLPRDGRKFARAVLSKHGDLVFASEGLTKADLSHANLFANKQLVRLPEGIFTERLLPPQRLFVFGAGDDAKPLVNMATLLGWRVAVLDGRPQLARAERFPEAEQVAVIRSISTIANEIDPDDAAVLMTHSYEQDRDLLAVVLPKRPRYLGLLGARHRSSLLIAETAAKLGGPVERYCEQICAPVGLDIGGEGPEAIALAVMAEVQACCAGKRAKSSRLSPRDVEMYIRDHGDASRYLQAQCALDLP